MSSVTANLGLTLPAGTDGPVLLRQSIVSNANLLDSYSLLTSVVIQNSNLSAQRGQSIVAGPSVTITLPAATANALVAVSASAGVSGANPVTVSAGAGIYGLGLNAASSFKLGTPGAFTVLQSDGTHWYVIAGQQDTGWITIPLTTVIANPGGYAPTSRLLGDRVYLRGSVENTSGSSISALTAIIKPTSTHRPISPVNLPATVGSGTVTAVVLNVQPSGDGFLYAALPNGSSVWFDGLSYTLS